MLALDFGARNLGLAVSDELGFTAQGLPTYRRTNKRNDFDYLRRLIRQYNVNEIVMGLPLRMSLIATRCSNCPSARSAR